MSRLAIGVIIGAAFGRVVDSLVGHVFMPIIGAVTAGLDFSNYFIRLSSAVTSVVAPGETARGHSPSAGPEGVKRLTRKQRPCAG
jgi:large conductance mechanosensitive channel protein